MAEFEESDHEEVSIEGAEESVNLNYAVEEPVEKKRRIGKYEIPIDVETAKANYAECGDEIDEDTNPMIITGAKYKKECFFDLIEEVKHDFGIDFLLQPFQVEAICALLSGKHVILVSPCGSGKLLVYYIAQHPEPAVAPDLGSPELGDQVLHLQPGRLVPEDLLH